MQIDIRAGTVGWSAPSGNDWRRGSARVTVDGEEIQQVWFLDTDNGLVKTYDVFGDGHAHSLHDCNAVAELPGVEILEGGLFSKTIRGFVEVLLTSPRRQDEAELSSGSTE